MRKREKLAREREKERERQTDRETETETERQRDTQTDRETERHRQTHRQTDRQKLLHADCATYQLELLRCLDEIVEDERVPRDPLCDRRGSMHASSHTILN